MKSHQVLTCHGPGVRELLHGPAYERHVVRDGAGLLAQPLDLLLLPSSARAILWADGTIPSIREDAIASLRRRNLPMRTKSGDAFTARARAST